MAINPLGIPVLDIGRDVNGRFRKANPGGPGNPFARKVAALRKALLDSVSEQDVKDMIEVLKQQARQGDRSAIKLLLQYCVGKPVPPQDPDRMDIDEWDRLQKMRVDNEQFQKTTQAVPACLACHFAQTAWPCNSQEGPFDHVIHNIHMDMIASGQPAATYCHPDDLPPECQCPELEIDLDEPGAEPVAQAAEPNTPTQPPLPKPERPASTKESKSKERREPAGKSRREGHSPTQAPLPNGENERDQMKTLELIQRLYPPAQPSNQPDQQPPKG